MNVKQTCQQVKIMNRASMKTKVAVLLKINHIQ